MQQIIQGNCLDVMKTFPDNHFNCVVTDPPYGLKFMNKAWDHGVPEVKYWKELYRICKPGSMIASFGGTRTQHRLTSAIEDAGWEIRDCIMWIYGQGFPKSHNKFGFNGYGTALKPAYEPIIIAMKPLDGTFAHNAEKWGVGGINIDDCRIEGTKISVPNPAGKCGKIYGFKNGLGRNGEMSDNSKGRWPANLLLNEESAAQLDEMTGNLKDAGNKNLSNITSGKSIFGLGNNGKRNPKIMGDNGGGASRFFYCAKASSKERNAGLEGMPLKEVAGCYGEFEGDGRGRQTENSLKKNNHPTVKPISLMKYLITLLAPPANPICLDPFAGSGSTLFAAKELGIDCIGIELSAEYCAIAEARINHARIPDPELF